MLLFICIKTQNNQGQEYKEPGGVEVVVDCTNSLNHRYYRLNILCDISI